MSDTPKLNNPELQKMVEDVLKEIKESQCIRITCEPCAALRTAEKVINVLHDALERKQAEMEDWKKKYEELSEAVRRTNI